MTPAQIYQEALEAAEGACEEASKNGDWSYSHAIQALPNPYTDDMVLVDKHELEAIARGPIVPLPDPEAHSWRAFGTRAATAMQDGMRRAQAMLTLTKSIARPCTCHPDDNPPVPCPRKYAITECRLAAAKEKP